VVYLQVTLCDTKLSAYSGRDTDNRRYTSPLPFLSFHSYRGFGIHHFYSFASFAWLCFGLDSFLNHHYSLGNLVSFYTDDEKIHNSTRGVQSMLDSQQQLIHTILSRLCKLHRLKVFSHSHDYGEPFGK